MAKRKKPIDIKNLSSEQVEILSVQIGEKVRKFCDNAVEKANKILSQYNMECKMAFKIQEIGTFPEKDVK